ncbi:PREDICTED: high mobility group B protein 7 isoform X1 [Tarenaya hassleriana]|uniref:high mobility group B protein 7 isoform X1 n=1 Tax=Tarenaya hassleriana TaxID=28532 RepID=UPI00053C5BAC|nr:PREDICTED: high mobility group B protein 7 isoform X1 [Tarenaya hassleriana]
MAPRPRARKRVLAPRRAADGSAYEKCDECGVTVAVALFDMHECGEKRTEVKRFKGISSATNKTDAVNQITGLDDQPRSAFVCFVEGFRKYFGGSLVDANRKCFEIWKTMPAERKEPFFIEAAEVNSAYLRRLDDESKSSYKVDDEADSSMVGKFDKFYENYNYEYEDEYSEEEYDSSDNFGYTRWDFDASDGY